MKKNILITLFLVTITAAVSAQPGTYFQAEIRKAGSNLEFVLRPNPGSNGGTNITNFRFDNVDFFVRQPIGEAATTFGAPVVNGVDFPGMTITQDPFGPEAYGPDPGYRIFEWSSQSASSTSSAMVYNAGQEYVVFSVPVLSNYSSNLQLSADNIAGTPYFLTITRNTAGIGGVSDYTAQGGNGSPVTHLFYTTGNQALLSFTPPSSYYQYVFDPLIVTPVTFSSYDVKCVTNGASLSWSTSFEQNSKHYEILRSKNGSTWEVIGTVPAAGNSNDIRHYSYLDISGGGSYQYRIRQVDFDGQFELTAIRATNCAATMLDVVLYPIPTKDKLNVVIKSDQAVKTELQVFDISGKVVKYQSVQINKGNNNFVMEVGNLSAGQYVLRSSDPTIQINKQFVIGR